VSNNGGNLNDPLIVKSIDRISQGICGMARLSVKMSTHTLRKTFCYWMMVRGHNDSRRLLLLQKMLGHSSPAQTLDYIGLTGEEIEDAYRHLNLGSAGFKFIDGNYIQELEAV
jgi:integrase